MTSEGKIVLIRQERLPIRLAIWEVPAGQIDEAKDQDSGAIEAIALRELREETGWEGQVSALLRINSRPDRPGEDRENVAFDFVVTPLRRVGEPDEESSAVEWVPIDRLPPLHTLAFDHGDTVHLYLASRGKPGVVPIVV